ncbi:MAG: POTRA domain-containing protein [Solimonas sp.]
MKQRGRWLAAALAGFAQLALAEEAPAPTAAEPPPTIREIVFEGNDSTREKTLRREIGVQVGDAADPARLEASRQAIQDLGLFKRVTMREEPVDGGVRIVFHVTERFYLLPLPRFDAKSDGRYSYGAQVRWDNAWGLNHSMRLLWQEQDKKEENIGRESQYSASYAVPFIGDSPYGFSVYGSYVTRPVENDDGSDYTENFRDAGFTVSRHFGNGPASQGWRVSLGLDYNHQETAGAAAPPAYGTAWSPIVGLSYRDWHYRIYSDIGTQFSLGYSFATDALGSDYHYDRVVTSYARYIPVGSTDHQTLHFIASGGWYFGGPPNSDSQPFGLGGSDALRGYDVNFREGDAFWLLQLEFARPLYKPWPWLRGVVILETGNVVGQAEDFEFDSPRTSLGFGLRVRFKNFVNFELEAGYAIPLTGGGGRVFASRV